MPTYKARVIAFLTILLNAYSVKMQTLNTYRMPFLKILDKNDFEYIHSAIFLKFLDKKEVWRRGRFCTDAEIF
jgi:hypothetical protein